MGIHLVISSIKENPIFILLIKHLSKKFLVTSSIKENSILISLIKHINIKFLNCLLLMSNDNNCQLCSSLNHLMHFLPLIKWVIFLLLNITFFSNMLGDYLSSPIFFFKTLNILFMLLPVMVKMIILGLSILEILII